MRVDMTEEQASLTVSALEHLRRSLAPAGDRLQVTDAVLSKLRTALNKTAAK